MSKQDTKWKSVAVATGALACFGAQAADAPAEGIQEVIVTAQKRAENLQTTPIAISAFTSETLENRGITDFAAIAQASTSISYAAYPYSPNTLIIYMRGQGVSDSGQVTSDSSIGLYQDGFYIARGQLVTTDIADVERVEVLRGPQGTLYGRNTTGGAVNIISKKPTGEFGIKQEVGFGSSGRFRSLTAVNLPKIGNFSTKFTFLKNLKDGFVENIGGGNDFGEEDQTAGRLALRYEDGGPFTADYFFEIGELDSTPYYYENKAITDAIVPGYSSTGKPSDKTYRAFDLPLSIGKFQTHGLTLAWEVSDNLTIKSLTGYRHLNAVYYQDYAEAFAQSFLLGFFTTDAYKSKQYSEELQFIGSAFDDHVKYVAGLYYFKEDNDHPTDYLITLPDAFGGPFTKNRHVWADAKSKAAFAQVTWTPGILDEKLDLTFGGRYTKDERSSSRTYVIAGTLVDPLTKNNLSYNNFSPSFTAAYAITDDVNVYAKWAKGYKAGGSSEATFPGQFDQTYGPEKVTSYELGLKSYFFDRTMRLNVAAFHSKFKDMQLFFVTDPNDSSWGIGQNAGEAKVDGVEVEALFQPTEKLSISLDYTYLDAKFEKVDAVAGTIFDPAVNPASPYNVGDNIAEIFSLPYTAENAVNLSVDYQILETTKGALSANFNYRWQDDFFATAPTGEAVPGREFYKTPAHGLLDGRLTWSTDLRKGQARVALWGKNLTNKIYPASVIGNGASIPVETPFGVSPGGYTNNAVAWAEHRTYGVNFIYEY